MKIDKVSPICYRVEGDSGLDYVVFYNPRTGEWMCTCPDSVHRMRVCKHIKAVLEVGA